MLSKKKMLLLRQGCINALNRDNYGCKKCLQFKIILLYFAVSLL